MYKLILAWVILATNMLAASNKINTELLTFEPETVLVEKNGNFLITKSTILEQDANLEIFFENDEMIFVSIGSWCNVSLNLRNLGLRKSAYPFDWIASVDCEKLLEIFRTDFRFFLDDAYLFIKDNHIFNSYYNLEFPHDLFTDPITIHQWNNFKDKYTRRIQRFKELETHLGKVYFIRSAFGYSNEPTRYFKCSENITISDDYSWRLFYALKERFPALDFTLVILDSAHPKKKLSENLLRLHEVSDIIPLLNLQIQSTL